MPSSSEFNVISVDLWNKKGRGQGVEGKDEERKERIKTSQVLAPGIFLLCVRAAFGVQGL